MSQPNRAKLLSAEVGGRGPSRCTACGRTNPPEAYYCYFDGRPLFKDLQPDPLNLATLPFPTPFCFSDGQSCTNFNQLAMACGSHWEEAETLLYEGIWSMFFSGMGRLDLAALANQVVNDSDRERGLSRFLERLPADPEFLRPAKAAFPVQEIQLGKLDPGTDLTFDLAVLNEGMLLLEGVITSTADWLLLGDQIPALPTVVGTPAVTTLNKAAAAERTWASQKLFQTRKGCTFPVRVCGDRLRAGLQPLRAEIFVESNGGIVTVHIRAKVPIRPFPRGIYANDLFAGVVSPRELALRAKRAPREAGVLFGQGAVRSWYASNGWTYPVEGADGSGVAAVQQFFEALGLTRPPQLELDADHLLLSGKPGQSLTTRIVVSTREGKPVYAHAWSNQPWMKVTQVKYMGAKVRISIDVEVPADSGDRANAALTIEGNGRQQFVVPVTIAVQRR